jgi:Ca-activated chloride channel family protein
MNAPTKISEEKLTAFVLGELPKEEAALLQSELESNPMLAQEAMELKKFCELVAQELKQEPQVSLDATQKAQLAQHMEAPVRRLPWMVLGPVLAAAAAIALFVYKQGAPQDLILTNSSSGQNEASLVRSVPAPSEPEPLAENSSDQARKNSGPKAKKEFKVARPSPPPAAKPSKFGRGQGNMGIALQGSGQPLSRAKSLSTGAMQGAGGQYLGSEMAMDRAAPNGGLAGDWRSREESNTEDYAYLSENDFKSSLTDPLSTFAIDVDTASYANVRRFLNQGQRPPKDAVRIEELVNYFDYSYKAPTDHRPFSVAVESASAPWKKEHRLVRIGLKGKDIQWADRPKSNLVFLLDVSGSMNSPGKLPLLKKSMKMLVENLGAQDRVAIVVYAGASGLVLPSTSAAESQTILDAIERLQAGGSTNGGAGIELAYNVAKQNFIKGGINRVLLATDGDFNVGTASRGALIRVIKEKARSGVFLSIFGFGMGNLKDSTMEELSGKGNGTYAYIDSITEAKKVLVQQIGGTMMTIAKDVKIQVEFNPQQVSAYRLIGYENRLMAAQDFHNDKKDGGEIGAGHTVTALYEIVPKGVPFKLEGQPTLKYQKPNPSSSSKSSELFTLKLRYKAPDKNRSTLDEYVIKDKKGAFADASEDFRFASSVAAFGMILRDSKYKGSADLKMVKEIAGSSIGSDDHGYRKDFMDLVGKAQKLK